MSRSYCAAFGVRSFNELRIPPLRLNGQSRFNSRLSLRGPTGRGHPRLVAFWLTAHVISVAAAPCVVLEGNPVQGGVLWGQTAPMRKSALLAFKFRYSMMVIFYWVWAAICPLLTNWW